MLKYFSDLHKADDQLFDDVIKAAKSEEGSNQWFCLKTFAEIERAAKFISAHSWEIDMSKLQPKFTSFEFDMINSMLKNNNPEAMKQRERACRTAAQRTQRFAEQFMSHNETRAQIASLSAQVARKPTSDMHSQWESLQSIFK